jgi:hypothetical protein
MIASGRDPKKIEAELVADVLKRDAQLCSCLIRS